MLIAFQILNNEAYLYIGRMACFSMQIRKCFSRQDERPVQISAWLMYLTSKRFLKLRGVMMSFFSEELIFLCSEFSENQHLSPDLALLNTAFMLKRILFALYTIIYYKYENCFCMGQTSWYSAKTLNFHELMQSPGRPVCVIATWCPAGKFSHATEQVLGWTSTGSGRRYHTKVTWSLTISSLEAVGSNKGEKSSGENTPGV